MDALARQQAAVRRLNHRIIVPALAAVLYPFLLRAFHLVIGPPGAEPTPLAILGGVLILGFAFAVPALGIVLAGHPDSGLGQRRLAYASVVAPTLYVFLGVVQGLLKSPLPDEAVWCVLWVGIALVAGSAMQHQDGTVAPIGRWRVAHGLGAAIVVVYVLFHVVNHLFGLMGPRMHAAVMDLGRTVYRAPVVEPVLVALLLFQAVTGLRLAWRWSATRTDFHRTFQVASGLYLSVFVIGHMNSVFVYARTYLGIQTDWAFATGAPIGLIHDAWNIRLLPHYLLGVFFVLAHLASGVRVVLLAHGAPRTLVDRTWLGTVILSAIIAAAIIAGMCGVRIGAPAP
jgi:hypothetical protein